MPDRGSAWLYKTALAQSDYEDYLRKLSAATPALHAGEILMVIENSEHTGALILTPRAGLGWWIEPKNDDPRFWGFALRNYYCFFATNAAQSILYDKYKVNGLVPHKTAWGCNDQMTNAPVWEILSCF